MEERMQKLRKNIKMDSFFIYLVSSIMVIIAMISVSDAVKYSMKQADAFEVRLVQEGGNIKEYCLFIDGENYTAVDYNEYARVDADGNENPKMCFIIDIIGSAVRYAMMAVLFGIACIIFRDVQNGSTPFNKQHVKRMQAMALLVILTALVPGAVQLVITLFIFKSAAGYFSGVSFLILLLGVLLGIISEIFKYGCELQEDMDQIA